MASRKHPIVGLIPAAGAARRLSPLPMSKELFPVGFQSLGSGSARPKVSAQYLLDRLIVAGVTEAYFVIRPGKWDIPGYFGDGSDLGIRLAYLTVHVPFGVPFTLNQAYPFVRHSIVALGFPDMLFWPENAYRVVLHRLAMSPAQVVLGLFPTHQPSQVGVVDVDDRGVVHGVYEKSKLTHLPFMWAIAVWKPHFTGFLHEFVEAELQALRTRKGDASEPRDRTLPPELPIGDVVHAAIRSGIRVEGEIFEAGACIDIGTPSNLLEAIYHELSLWRHDP